MTAVDYTQIQDDLVSLIQTNVPTFKMVAADLDERDHTFTNMPLADVSLGLLEPEPRAGGEYVFRPTYAIEIVTFDLSSYREAVIIRQSLMSSVHDAIKGTPQFSSELEDALLGTVEFKNAFDDEKGAFISACTMLVHCVIIQY